MKTVAPGAKLRARWFHPDSGDRLVLVGKSLFRARPTGDYRFVFAGTAATIKAYARRHGFRRVNNTCFGGGGTDSDFAIDPRATVANETQLNFRRYIDDQQYHVGRDRTLSFDPLSQMLLESIRIAPPVSSLDDGTPGSRVRYLRRLALHGKRVAKDGYRGNQTRTTKDIDRREKKYVPKSLPWWAISAFCAHCNKPVRSARQNPPPGASEVTVKRVMRTPVVVRVNDRPYCPKCVPAQKTA